MSKYSEKIKSLRQSPSYWANLVGMEFTDGLYRLMEEQQVSQAQLAQRLGTSEAYVSKALRGNANFTLKTMIKLARALNAVLHVHVAEEGVVVRWQTESEDPERIVQLVRVQVPKRGISTYTANPLDVNLATTGDDPPPTTVVWRA